MAYDVPCIGRLQGIVAWRLYLATLQAAGRDAFKILDRQKRRLDELWTRAATQNRTALRRQYNKGVKRLEELHVALGGEPGKYRPLGADTRPMRMDPVLEDRRLRPRFDRPPARRGGRKVCYGWAIVHQGHDQECVTLPHPFSMAPYRTLHAVRAPFPADAVRFMVRERGIV